MSEYLAGRRDFDVVSFEDYENDMRESSARAVAAIEMMERRAKNAERMLALVVKAAGGRVVIPYDLREERTIELLTERDFATLSIVLWTVQP